MNHLYKILNRNLFQNLIVKKTKAMIPMIVIAHIPIAKLAILKDLNIEAKILCRINLEKVRKERKITNFQNT